MSVTQCLGITICYFLRREKSLLDAGTLLLDNSEKSGPVFRLSWEAHEQRRVKFVIDRHNKGHTTHKLSRNIKSILHKQKKF